MFTRLRITTPLPTFAPKIRSTMTLNGEGTGNHGANNSERHSHHMTSFHRGTPRV
jgi:hypothetical protein